ncbi:MAG: fumarate hydratase [Candidatus Nezhaarchaeales archaeon]
MKVVDEETLYEIALTMIKKCVTRVAPDVLYLLKKAYENEKSPIARKILETMISNSHVAQRKAIPLCQSPGYPVIYVKMGAVKIDANIQRTFQRAIIEATNKGLLRPSMVHPITRRNPGDNSGVGIPEVEVELVPEMDYSELVISFKGCGAELPNAVRVFTPAEVGKEGIGLKKFIIETVAEADGIPCPPMGIGVGIGGQMHTAAKLSRKAIGTRLWTDTNPDVELAKLEEELLHWINLLGIGPAGLGGDTTALTVKVEMAYTHTAICPVAVNFHCWAVRRATTRLLHDGSIVFVEDEYAKRTV